MKIKKTVKINGMHCAGCAKRVENALGSLDGVKAKVDLKNGSAALICEREPDTQAVKTAIEELGFEFEGII